MRSEKTGIGIHTLPYPPCLLVSAGYHRGNPPVVSFQPMSHRSIREPGIRHCSCQIKILATSLDLMKTTMNLAPLDHLEFRSPQLRCDLNHIAPPLGKPANGQKRALDVPNHFATSSFEDYFCKLSPRLWQADQL